MMKAIIIILLWLIANNSVAKELKTKQKQPIQCRIWKNQLKFTTGKQHNKLVERLWVRCGV